MLSAHNHNYRQQLMQTRTDDSVINNATVCHPVPHRKLISTSILTDLIHEFVSMKDLELLNVAMHEEEFINNTFIKSDVVTDFLINLQRHQKRKLRENFRKTLQEGVMRICSRTTLGITTLWYVCCLKLTQI